MTQTSIARQNQAAVALAIMARETANNDTSSMRLHLAAEKAEIAAYGRQYAVDRANANIRK